MQKAKISAKGESGRMQLHNAWRRFFICTLAIIILLCAVIIAVLYNSSAGQETERTAIIEDFVQNQKLDLIKNVVNNMVADINMQKFSAEETAASEINHVAAILRFIDAGEYADDMSVGRLLGVIGEVYDDIQVLAYNRPAGTIFGSSGSTGGSEDTATAGSEDTTGSSATGSTATAGSEDTTGTGSSAIGSGYPQGQGSADEPRQRRAFENVFADYTAFEIFTLNDSYLIGFGVLKSTTYDIVMKAMQSSADSQIPLGDIEIRIDALNSYDMKGDFATRIITPFFQRSSGTFINAENADYIDVLEQLLQNGDAHTVNSRDGQLERIVYARLYRSYDWIISASVSAEDIGQLTEFLADKFVKQQNNYILVISLLCLIFSVLAIAGFILLGRLFYRKADSEFKTMYDLNYVDSLTEIFNRRYLDDTLQNTIDYLARVENGELSIFMVDIDFFKQYNDAYGHQKGDECLRRVAQTLAGTLYRATDITARYGGEEFAVVLPYTGKAGAIVVAEKLLTCIRNLNIAHEHSDAAAYVTVSIGAVSSRVWHTHDWKEYIKRADEALYMSKNNGRDRYTYLDYKDTEMNEE